MQPDVKHKTATAHINFQASMAATVQNEGNIKIGLKLIGWKGVQWICLVRNRALVNAVMNHRVL
jgi:hypothetical protein